MMNADTIPLKEPDLSPLILIVEDNFMNRDMLARRLKRRNFRVVDAVNGPDGLQIARREHPDLIVLDISIPVIDGYEVARRLKNDPATAAIPIIALTAHALSEDRERALSAGCDEYTTKPVNFGALLILIHQLLEQKGNG